MEHFKQTESFMDLFDFAQPILENTESDPFGGNQLQRQFTDCAGGVCKIDNYRTGSNLLSNSSTDPRRFGGPGTANLGLGGTGGNFQNQRLAIKPGFGQGNGNFYPRQQRRTFNREFQRGSYTGGQYEYQQGLPSSYYPNTYSHTEYPYQGNYDPYPSVQQPQGQQSQGQQPQGPLRPINVSNQSQNDAPPPDYYGGQQQMPSQQYNYYPKNNYYDDSDYLPPQQDPLAIIQKLSQELPRQFQPELQMLQDQLQQQQQAQVVSQVEIEVPGMPWVPLLLAISIMVFMYYSPELTKIYF